MYNDLLTIGPVTIHGYGLMTAVGILAAYFSAEYRAKKKGLDADKVFGLVICCVVLGYICSKLLYIITVLPDILADPSLFLSSLANGWVVLGGILGGILGGYLYCRWKKLPAWKFFDVGLASVALAQGFGRIGCFLAGCCYGAETSGPLAVTFTHSDFAPNGVPLVPTQLISSAPGFSAVFLPDPLSQPDPEKGRRDHRLVSDPVQRRTVRAGILERRHHTGICGAPVHLSVHEYLYLRGRDPSADPAREEQIRGGEAPGR